MRSGGSYLVIPESRVLYFGTEDSLTRLIADGGSTDASVAIAEAAYRSASENRPVRIDECGHD